jgi:hypothetical protein
MPPQIHVRMKGGGDRVQGFSKWLKCEGVHAAVGTMCTCSLRSYVSMYMERGLR